MLSIHSAGLQVIQVQPSVLMVLVALFFSGRNSMIMFSPDGVGLHLYHGQNQKSSSILKAEFSSMTKRRLWKSSTFNPFMMSRVKTHISGKLQHSKSCVRLVSQHQIHFIYVWTRMESIMVYLHLLNKWKMGFWRSVNFGSPALPNLSFLYPSRWYLLFTAYLDSKWYCDYSPQVILL